jgi:phosphoglycerate kinase
MSHLGRPGGKYSEELSLISVGETLADLLETQVKFTDDCISEDAISVSRELRPGEIHLLENLRFHKGEKRNNERFSMKLASHGELYVNDAFGTAHRAHASNVGVPNRFSIKAMGFLMEKEKEFLYDTLKNPARPLTIILGGSKISGKFELIGRFLKLADHILIGGGMAFTFLKAKGLDIGASLFQEDMVERAESYLRKAKKRGGNLILPSDCAVKNKSSRKIVEVNQLGEKDIGMDIGPETIKNFRDIISQSNSVVWNGPMGVFEEAIFNKGTQEICREVGSVVGRGGISIIGGGDSAAAVRTAGMERGMSHISTGGGASLELLAGKELPAFQALEE